MPKKVLGKTDLNKVLTRLMDHYRVYAPVRHNDTSSFQNISDPEQASFDLRNTTLSPKSLMLPQSELMFGFTLDGSKNQVGILQETKKDLSPRVIFGIRPCDAKAFQLLDLNFNTALYRDPWWVGRRQSTTLVGWGCDTPCTTCFCSSVGSAPFSPAGLDILLTDLEDQLVLESQSDRGLAILEKAGLEEEATDVALEAARLKQEAALQSIESKVPTQDLKSHDVNPLFNADFWEDVHFACINCGVCTFVCPTCWCFDIQDEVHRGNGVRLRNWDACMFPLFTLHGSGHNPRSQKLQRLRQRFMHKLKYFVDKYDRGVACVGCGRCVQQCPVNIDIREVFRLMNNFKV
jgi:ferredoxin